MEHSPDGKAYLVSHGASGGNPKPRYANCSWITGDEIYLARVTPSIENINDGSKYEFFAGRDAAGGDLWSQKLADARPIAAWNNNMGCVTMTYMAPLREIPHVRHRRRHHDLKVQHLPAGIRPCDRAVETGHVHEEFRRAGVLRQHSHRSSSAPTAARSGSAMRPISTGGWPSNPPGSRYGMCLQEVRLLGPGVK